MKTFCTHRQRIIVCCPAVGKKFNGKKQKRLRQKSEEGQAFRNLFRGGEDQDAEEMKKKIRRKKIFPYTIPSSTSNSFLLFFYLSFSHSVSVSISPSVCLPSLSLLSFLYSQGLFRRIRPKPWSWAEEERHICRAVCLVERNVPTQTRTELSRAERRRSEPQPI